MALNILIASGEKDWIEEAEEYFKEISYDVVTAQTGKEVQMALYDTSFFAIILSLNIKNHSGIQVLRFIKQNSPSQRVIVTVEDESEFEDLGTAEHLVSKYSMVDLFKAPYEAEDIGAKLEGHHGFSEMLSKVDKREGVSEEESCSVNDGKFTKIAISEFYTTKTVLFDLFVKINDNTYVKILKAGDYLPKERLDKYKYDKGAEYLYFNKSDISKYIKLGSHLADKVLDLKTVKTSKKVKMIQNVASKFLEVAFEDGLSNQSIDQGKEISEKIFKLVQTDKNVYSLLRGYQDFDPSAYDHAYLVSLFATATVKQFEWHSRSTIENMALACLFHDIGLSKLGSEFIGLKVSDMSPEQYESYKMHPLLGVKMMEGNNMVNHVVKQIIIQHHEFITGDGFPSGKKGSQVLTLSSIVSLSSEFVNVIQDNGLKPVEAVKVLFNDKKRIQQYSTNIIENFFKIFTDGKIIKKTLVKKA